MLITPSPSEKIDPRIKRTRQLILAAFEELLAEKGFAKVTVKDITERAGINRATFYAHFPDKFALLQSSIQQAFRQELEKRTLSACRYSPENLQALIVTVCEFIARSRQGCPSHNGQFDSLVEAQVRAQIQALLELWLEQNATEKGEILAIAAAWSIYGLAQYWSGLKTRPPSETYARQISPIILSLLAISSSESALSTAESPSSP